jgi:hypothetical protein
MSGVAVPVVGAIAEVVITGIKLTHVYSFAGKRLAKSEGPFGNRVAGILNNVDL